MSPHPNDTLQGRLINSEWEDPDERHLRHSFGYWRMIEHRMIRAQMKAEGLDPGDYIEMQRRSTTLHQNDPTLREQQARNPPDVEKVRGIWLSTDELIWLSDRIDGVNDPLGANVLAKALEALRRGVL